MFVTWEREHNTMDGNCCLFLRAYLKQWKDFKKC